MLNPSEALSTLLKTTGRSTAPLGPLGFNALGLDLKIGVDAAQLIPDPQYVPDFEQWTVKGEDESNHDIFAEDCLRTNSTSSSGAKIYRERRRELSNNNADAFRTIRRLAPPPGKQQARLGSAYEFFRSLEAFTPYWEDPSQNLHLPPSPELGPNEPPSKSTSLSTTEGPKADDGSEYLRTDTGSAMPMDLRRKLISAFIKMVAYDFGCTVGASSIEPRLQLSSPAGHSSPRKSYIASHCHFVYQSPQTREAARNGLVQGPVASVSCRNTTDFSTPDLETAQSLDLAREVVAALVTAQHRNREDKTETRFGLDQWWTTKPRWGGGPGGPIGREVTKDDIPGDKDAKPSDNEDGTGAPTAKKPRRNLAIYDTYRMVRPPRSTWDRKTQFKAIGKGQYTNYDDIFVVSSLFHHVSFIRIRVPLRLLEVLDGSLEPDLERRSWGKVQAWRTSWYDLFDANQRIEGMQMMWAIMAYQMRSTTSDKDATSETV